MTEPAEASDQQAPAARRRPPAVRWALLFALVFIPIAAVVWIAAPDAACACSPVPTPDIASPVDGVVISVDSAGLGQVRGFTLRTDGGFAFLVTLGTLENATEFSPSHLAEHMASSEPIRAWFRLENSVPVVYRLEDAPD